MCECSAQDPIMLRAASADFSMAAISAGVCDPGPEWCRDFDSNGIKLQSERWKVIQVAAFYGVGTCGGNVDCIEFFMKAIGWNE